jgi:PAS domain S-box-containing protein
LLHDLPDCVVVINSHGIIVNANKALERLLGYAPQQVIGSNVSILCPSPHREQHDYYLERYFSTGVKRVVGRTREVTAQAKDGRLIPVALSVSETLFNGESFFTGIVRDNSNVAHMQHDIVATEARAKAVLDSSPNGVIVVDATRGIVTSVNRAAERMTQYEEKELVGRTLTHIVAHDLSNVEEDFMNGARREVIGVRKDGTEFLALVSVSRIDVQGQMCLCVMLEDITRSRESELRMKAVFEGARDAILTTSDDGHILSANPAFFRLFGYASDVDDVSVIDLSSHITSHDDGEGHTCMEAIRKDGSLFPCEVTRSDVSIGHNRVFALIIRDITSRKKAEEARALSALLETMLPPHIAQRMLNDPTLNRIAERYDHACILFTDIKGFTAMSANMAPQDVAAMLAEMFEAFDTSAKKFGVEKVKTIGDSYMCGTGLRAGADECESVVQMARFAVEVLESMKLLNARSGRDIQIRVGMHCGPVMCGVLSRTKPVMDTFGAVVNYASRMESTGVPGKVQVSERVAEVIRGASCEDIWVEEREDAVQVKGVGMARTYFLKYRNVKPTHNDHEAQVMVFGREVEEPVAETPQSSTSSASTADHDHPLYGSHTHSYAESHHRMATSSSLDNSANDSFIVGYDRSFVANSSNMSPVPAGHGRSTRPSPSPAGQSQHVSP